MIFSMYPTYPLIKCVSFLNERSRRHSARRTNNQSVTQNNLRKIGCKVFDTVLGLGRNIVQDCVEPAVLDVINKYYF